jgi:hypothetical protein
MRLSVVFVEYWVVENNTLDHDGTEVSCVKRRYYVETVTVSMCQTNVLPPIFTVESMLWQLYSVFSLHRRFLIWTKLSRPGDGSCTFLRNFGTKRIIRHGERANHVSTPSHPVDRLGSLSQPDKLKTCWLM